MTKTAALAMAIGTAILSARATTVSASPAADEALALCDRAASAPAEQKAALVARGLEIADQALRVDERDARAHFAAFCNLGRQMELAGAGLGNLVGIRRLRREIDLTLTYAPDYVDALIGKGLLLLNLPRLLGGSKAEAERLAGRALALVPDHVEARQLLAEIND